MKTIVSVSGGLSSFEALRRVIAHRGRENVIAVFADVKGYASNHHWSPVPAIEPMLHERFGGESADTYRFLWEMSYALDMPIERLEDGRTIFNLFASKRAFRLKAGAFWYAPCSEALKRHTIADWIEANFAPGEYEIALGMKWDEAHRTEKAQVWWAKRLGWEVRVFSPLADKPFVESCDISVTARRVGITTPDAYGEGFANNNCSGGCVHAGQGQFASLYQLRNGVFHSWAWQEHNLNRYWGKRATILKDDRGGVASSMSLDEFIPRIETGDYRQLDLGGCGCFTNAMIGDFLTQAEVSA